MNKYCVLFSFIILLIASCTPVKKVIYYQEGRKNIIDSSKIKTVTDTTRNKFAPDTTNNKFELKIFPGAILAITVFTANSEAIAYFTPIGPIPADPRSGYER